MASNKKQSISTSNQPRNRTQGNRKHEWPKDDVISGLATSNHYNTARKPGPRPVALDVCPVLLMAEVGAADIAAIQEIRACRDSLRSRLGNPKASLIKDCVQCPFGNLCKCYSRNSPLGKSATMRRSKSWSRGLGVLESALYKQCTSMSLRSPPQ
jgi:hypothetical protein